MKNFISTISLILVSIIFGACEDVVQIKLDEGSKLYVIDAFVNDLRQDQVIRVTTNDTYFSNRIAPPVENASVVLRDLTANRQFVFDYKGGGNYVFTLSAGDTISRKNHQYELNVTIEGETYTSLTTQKRTAVIDSIGYELFTGGGFGGPVEEPFYFCTLYARDKVDNQADYYWIKTFRNDSLLFTSSDINISIDGTNAVVNNVVADTLPFTPPATFIGFKRYLSKNTCGVEIHSISSDTYNFFLQAAAQINNGGLFATTPENVKTNILTPSSAKTRAIGWFNMATVTSKKIILP